METASASCTDSLFMAKHKAVRATVGVTCFFSMIGSLLITASFIFFKRLRTNTRFILLNMSLMDFGVALANAVGVIANFDHYYYNSTASTACRGTATTDSHAVIDNKYPMLTPTHDIRVLCTAQAVLAHYATISSVLWTISLAVYLYFRIVQFKTKKAFYSLIFSFIICYTLPLLIVLWSLLTNRLGFSPYNSSGWCSLIIYNPKTDMVDKYFSVFGYDLWIYLTMFMVGVLIIGLRLYLADQAKTSKKFVSEKRFWDAVHTLDYKFVLVPLCFILLRMWTCIVNILMYFNEDFSKLPWGVALALILLCGIGDSGQGMVNGILFVFLTKPVRQRLASAICCRTNKLTLSQTVQGPSTHKPNIVTADEKTPFLIETSTEEIP